MAWSQFQCSLAGCLSVPRVWALPDAAAPCALHEEAHLCAPPPLLLSMSLHACWQSIRALCVFVKSPGAHSLGTSQRAGEDWQGRLQLSEGGGVRPDSQLLAPVAADPET
mmetsp:Transcript_13118/g.39707  ORF Transcript_13118/g.39707 Transcript_13118/m.39707 type:complete len:110 (+) Transcript_13118:1991-2320(+)